jgi:predicted regulator of Ras-like GTPase activity (Roadblock/LC7/MglB family)
MALKGTLQDLGVLDLVQFVNQARKTGALTLKGNDGEARLYYRQGKLVHAKLEDLSGLEVLVKAVDWDKGDFEFQDGIETQEETIRMDLHRAAMQAVKLRDERKLEEEKKRQAAEEAKARADAQPALADQLQQLAAGADFLLHACVVGNDGRVQAAMQREQSADGDIKKLCASLMKIVKAYPRAEIRRAFFEDEAGTIVVARVSEESTLVAVADRGAALGAVTMAVNKIITRLNVN